MNSVDALIVGGGISGLSCAWWLQQSGLSVAVWEKNGRAGGKIGTEVINGYRTERAATLLRDGSESTRVLLSQSGLAHCRPRSGDTNNRYIGNGSRLQIVPMTPAALLRSSLWSTRSKLRLLAEPFIPRRVDDNETVSSFVRRRLGTELLEKAMEPYIAGPLASDPDRANARALLPRLTGLERRYGSISMGILAHRLKKNRETCGMESTSFEEGMEQLVRRLASIPAIGFQQHTETTSIEPDGDGWRVYASKSGTETCCHARHVILSTPSRAAAQLVQHLDPALASELSGIEYAPVTVVHTGFDREIVKHPLDGPGFLTPRNDQCDVNGVLWMSSLFPQSTPQRRVLFTSYLGGARNVPAATMDDPSCIDAVYRALKTYLAIDGEADMVHIVRHRRALPQYFGNYPARLSSIEQHLAQHNNLHISANYMGGVSIRDRIHQARLLASNILERHQKSSVNTAPDESCVNGTYAV